MRIEQRIKTLLLHRPGPAPEPLADQLTDAARVLIGNGDRELAADVSDVIHISRDEIPDSLYAVFEDLLITCQRHEEDPDDGDVANIRAYVALIKRVSTRPAAEVIGSYAERDAYLIADSARDRQLSTAELRNTHHGKRQTSTVIA